MVTMYDRLWIGIKEWARSLEGHQFPRLRKRGLLLLREGEATEADLNRFVREIHAAGGTLFRHPEAADVKRQDPSTDNVSSSTEKTTPFTFAREGTGFYIEGFGERGHVGNLKGFRQIQRLITASVPVPMLEVDEATDERIQADQRSVQPVIDREAERAFRDRLVELDEERELADELQNYDRVEACQEQMDQILTELGRATNVRGEARDLNSYTDKLRAKIHGTLKTAYRKLREAQPPMEKLADHFEASMRSEGTAYVYDPAMKPRPQWESETRTNK